MRASTSRDEMHPDARNRPGNANRMALPMILAATGCAVLLIASLTGLTALLLLPLTLLAVPLTEFVLTPLWRWAGVYRYHSPMLFTVARSADRLELHTGTGYDFAIHAWRTRGGLLRSRGAVLLGVVQGLLDLIGEIEAGRIPPRARICATSYFFSNSSAGRLGFLICPPPPAERLHLLLNLFTLLVTYSYVRQRLAVPPVWRVKTAEISAGALLRRKPRLQRLAARLASGGALPKPRRG